MREVLQIFIAIFPIILYSQNITIKGIVMNSSDSTRLSAAVVNFDNKIGTTCDYNGKFSLTFDKGNLKDTLKISFIGFRQLLILNLPKDVDTIDLGEIPMFSENPSIPIFDFFCKWYNFRCKRKAKKFWKNVEKEFDEYEMKINNEIEKFKYFYKNKPYRIKNNDTYLNGTLTLDLVEPSE